jgi:hypothetical protein
MNLPLGRAEQPPRNGVIQNRGGAISIGCELLTSEKRTQEPSNPAKEELHNRRVDWG